MCIECEELNANETVWAVGELNNDLYAICTCPQGHKFLSGLMHHVPDVLYMSAVSAFRKECYSESILSFTAAFERTCELFFKAFSLRHGSSIELVDEMWTELKNQSERQYGAFCLAYCITTSSAWKADNKQVEFRNKVVHKGYIATKSEAELYAGYITEKLNMTIALLSEKFKEECQKIYFFNRNQISPKLRKIMAEDPSLKFFATGIPSLLNWDHGDRKSVSFSEVIKKAEQLENNFGH
jgi:hypothetical protein